MKEKSPKLQRESCNPWVLFTAPLCRACVKCRRWTYFSGNQEHVSQRFELYKLSVTVCRLWDWTHSRVHTHTLRGTCFSAHGAQEGEEAGWQKLEWESVVPQLTSPLWKVLHAAAAPRWKEVSASDSAALSLLKSAAATLTPRVSFHAGSLHSVRSNNSRLQ